MGHNGSITGFPGIDKTLFSKNLEGYLFFILAWGNSCTRLQYAMNYDAAYDEGILMMLTDFYNSFF